MKKRIKEMLLAYYVGRQNKVIKDDHIYYPCIQEMALIDIVNICETDINSIVRDEYLYKWGGMGRVLGQIDKYPDWESNLMSSIRRYAYIFEHFRLFDIATTDLKNYKQEIILCYESLQKLTGRVASVKILHLICPKFFPLWDSSIIKGISAEIKFDDKNSPSGEDYLRYMQTIKNILEENADMIDSLAKHFKKDKLKIIDELLMWVTQRPFSIFIS